MSWSAPRFLSLLALILLTASAAEAETYVYRFDSDLGSFSGTDGWISQYCTDPWTTALNGGVFPRTDHGCNTSSCTSWNNCGYNWGYQLYGGTCVNSDPLDNHMTFGPKTWRNYRYSVSFKNDDDDTVGVVFRYNNSGQFYLFMMSRDQAPHPNFGCNISFSGARLLKIKDSHATVLEERELTYQPGMVHSIRVSAIDSNIKIEFDSNGDGQFAPSEVLMDLTDSNPLPNGQIGLYAYENGAGTDTVCAQGGCWFDDVIVEVLDNMSDPCQGIPWEGRCEDNTLLYCENGQLKTDNCQNCCGWSNLQDYYNCFPSWACGDCYDECSSGDAGCSQDGSLRWYCGNSDTDSCNERIWTSCELGLCNTSTAECVSNWCIPDCTDKECGDDGCGSSCGTCQDGRECLQGICSEPCIPECDNKECGSDGCGGKCGTCPPGESCDSNQICQPGCVPDCNGKECGDDGCGGQCGSCDLDMTCNLDTSLCVADCQPNCQGKQCGSDGCEGSCGSCPPSMICNQARICISTCTPNCEGKECGDDGCDGQCGFCATNFYCSQGLCQPGECVPDCNDAECGSDGCGGTCGQCSQGYVCRQSDQVCVPGECQPDCLGAQCGDDGCGGSCGQCQEGQTCDQGLCTNQCVPMCLNKECGPDGCGGTCGVCGEDQYCSLGTCQPALSCAGFCGSTAPGGCSCKADCAAHGSCCGDLCQACPQTEGCNCVPDCMFEGRMMECGNDGCGGSCGDCGEGKECVEHKCQDQNPLETCEDIFTCMDDCMGDEGCAGICFISAPTEAREAFTAMTECINQNCQDCPAGSTCFFSCLFEDCGAQTDACYPSEDGTCGDILDCALACQGNDECTQACFTLGGSSAKSLFFSLYQCIEVACPGGGSGCAATAIQIQCYQPYKACRDHCIPRCTGKVCGVDGCGGQCGTCQDDETCVQGQCISTCVPACAGRDCGDDGCGGQCGTCPEDSICDQGNCVEQPVCNSHHVLRCDGSALYWYDSCDKQEALALQCPAGCDKGKCLEPTDEDTTSSVDDLVSEADTSVVEPYVFTAGGASSSSCNASDQSRPDLLILILGLMAALLRLRKVSRT